MSRPPRVQERWKCPTCGHEETTPIPTNAILCPVKHPKTRVMKKIWDRKSDQN